MKIRPILILIIISLALSAFIAQAQEGQFETSSHISNNKVNVFAQDKNGYMWIGTERGLNRYNGYTYKTYFANKELTGLYSDNITAMTFDSTGRLWVGTNFGISYMKDGIFHHHTEPVFNRISKLLDYDEMHILALGKDGFVKFQKEGLVAVEVFSDSGSSYADKVIITKNSDIWYISESNDESHIVVLDGKLREVNRYNLGKDVSVTCICEDVSQVVWVATNKGLISFDSRSGSKNPVPAPLKHLKGKIHFALPFWAEGLLFGIQGKGLLSYNIRTQTLDRIVKEQSLEGDGYVCFVDKSNTIWLSDGITEPKTYLGRRPYLHYYPTDDIESIKEIHNMEFDKEGYLWMVVNHTLTAMDVNNNGAVTYKSTLSDKFNDILIDSDNNLWGVVDFNKLYKYRLSEGKASFVKQYSFDNSIFTLSEEKDGSILISSVRSFYSLDKNGSISRILTPSNLPFTLSLQDKLTKRTFIFSVSNGLHEITDDYEFRQFGGKAYKGVSYIKTCSDGNVWLGFNRNGLIRLNERTGEEMFFDENNGLFDNSIRSIEEDHDGNIWISTSEHIWRYNTATQRFSGLHDDRFVKGKTYNLVSSAVDTEGRLYFGGTGGITVIDPKMEIPEKNDIPLFLESVTVKGKYISGGIKELTVKHNENMMQFFFSAVDYESGSSINYSFIMDGYEEVWHEGNHEMQAIYNYLPPGKYTFRARVREGLGDWSPYEINIPVTVAPSPWLSPWAKLAYFILSIALLFSGAYLFMRMRVQRERIKLADAREMMNIQHSEFMANIAHEFKTPLSLIYGPAKELGKIIDNDSPARMYVDTIQRNADRLKIISKEIFNVIKSAEKDNKLNVCKSDLAFVVRLLSDNFRFSLLEKSMKLTIECDEKLPCYFDVEKFTKIFTNLMSNAIKYGRYEGSIVVSIKVENGHALISVKDDGKGIPEEKRSRLFERFDRLDADKNSPEIQGFGIGLNYSYRMAKSHKGTLYYEPNHPQGSIFTIDIPVGEEAYSEDEMGSPEFITEIYQNNAADATINTGDKQGTVLIVEDNADVRNFLTAILNEKYNIMSASDGMEAEDMLKITLPDLVLSDCVMPNKTGNELCYDIKHNEDWSHLPVILLTAKNDHESTLMGLRQGADVYIPKPFDPDYLKTVIHTQINNRRLVQNKILNLTSSSIAKETDGGTIMNAAGTEFIKKIHSVLDANIDNDLFGINELASEMNMSYSSLYSKVKSLTGNTPQAYVKTYRMNIAIELLRTGLYTVGEVADKVGASSPFTFSREFKAHFGFPPSKAKQS